MLQVLTCSDAEPNSVAVKILAQEFRIVEDVARLDEQWNIRESVSVLEAGQ